MIICHSRKFVFVKTNKTAGSSFEGLLCHYLADNDMITAINLKVERDYINTILEEKNVVRLNGITSKLDKTVKEQFSQHVPLTVANSVFPETKDYFSFGIVRNPFNRHLSSFRWKRGDAIKNLLEKTRNTKKAEQKLQDSFLNFIQRDRGMLLRRGRNLLQGTHPDGTSWNVDCIYKLEDLNHLEKDLMIKDIIGDLDTSKMPRFKSDTVKIPKEINIWNEEIINAVRISSSWEIEQMGYHDTPEDLMN